MLQHHAALPLHLHPTSNKVFVYLAPYPPQRVSMSQVCMSDLLHSPLTDVLMCPCQCLGLYTSYEQSGHLVGDPGDTGKFF